MRRLFWLPLLLSLCSGLASSVAADDPLERFKAPFMANAEALQDAFDQLGEPDEGSSVQILLNRTVYEIDDEGRLTLSLWRIFKPLDSSGAARWDTVCSAWEPWRQQQPELAARVLAPDGKILDLEPEAAANQPRSPSGEDMFEDDQLRCAPLPGIEIGAIVEETVVVRDNAALYPVGVIETTGISLAQPAAVAAMIIRLPQSTELKWQVHGLEPDLESDTTKNGRRQLELRFYDPPYEFDPPVATPPDHVALPTLFFTTVPSWQAAASAYDEIVNTVLEGEDPSAWLEDLEPRADRREIVRHVLDRIADTTRYTGLELGSGAIIPRPPSVVASRRFGDCKDLSTLVVAALRSRGFEASVALLRAGGGIDVRPDLPGMNLFNHAIVHVPGDDPLWIDPTAPRHALDSPPLSIQGRWALIADSNTTELVSIPVRSAATNLERLESRYEMHALGKARIVERTIAIGAPALRHRSMYAEAGAEKAAEVLATYAKRSYSVEKLTSHRVLALNDEESPFELHLELDDAQVADGDDRVTVVPLYPKLIEQAIPFGILGGDEESSRELPLEVWQPSRREWRFEVLPATGFAPRNLPETVAIDLGPARFEASFELEEDGLVVAEMSFDTGARRYQPEEVNAFAEALEELDELLPFTLVLEHRGMSLLDQGRLPEAVTELRRLTALEPEVAAHHLRFADALLAAGLGDAAITEGRRAVELEPDSGVTWHRYANILQHDSVGRYRSPSVDFEAAEKAFAKAIELAEKPFMPAMDEAIMYEHDRNGRRFVDPLRCSKASDLYLEYLEELEDLPGMAANVFNSLYCSNRHQELLEITEKLPVVEATNTFELLARVQTEGLDAALAWAERDINELDERRDAFRASSQTLIGRREYESAVALLDAAVAIGGDQASAISQRRDELARVRRVDPDSFDPEDPVSAALSLLAVGVAGEETSLEDLVASSFLEAARERLTEQLSGLDADIPDGVPDHKAYSDAALSLFENQVSEDLGGWSIDLINHLAGDREAMRVIREDGRLVVLGSDRLASGVGIEVLRAIDADELERAATHLDWLRRRATSSRGEDPLAGALFARAWPRIRGDATQARLAAAVLLVASERNDLARTELEALEAEELFGDLEAVRIAALLSTLEVDRDWAEMVNVASSAYETWPDSVVAVAAWSRGLSLLDRSDEALEVLRELSDLLPDEPQLHFAEVQALIIGDRIGAARQAAEDAILKTAAPRGFYNISAWLDVIDGQVSERSLERSLQSLESRAPSASRLHTLATVYAELERPNEARQALLRAIAAARDREPQPHDFYVIGRIAESLDLPDIARTNYLKVEPEEFPEDVPQSTLRLAQRRLEGLLEGLAVEDS